MIAAKLKIKTKGQHAEQLLQQLPSLGIKTVQVERKPLPSKKGKSNASNSQGRMDSR